VFLENCQDFKILFQGVISSSSAYSSSSSWVRDGASESEREEASAVEKTTIPP
jgi:hypothetical protein